mgnify:CR=1 FL=1
MRKVTEISPTQDYRPVELRHLCVAIYCRVSIGRPAVSNCKSSIIHS